MLLSSSLLLALLVLLVFMLSTGPPATDKAAVRAFRLFWGPRAQMRRFKDGSILETVVWSSSGNGGSGSAGGAGAGSAQQADGQAQALLPPRLVHLLPGSVMDFLLQRHFSGCSITCVHLVSESTVIVAHVCVRVCLYVWVWVWVCFLLGRAFIQPAAFHVRVNTCVHTHPQVDRWRAGPLRVQ